MPVVVAAVNTQLGRVKLGDMFSLTWEYDVYGTPPTPRDNALTPGAARRDDDFYAAPVRVSLLASSNP